MNQTTTSAINNQKRPMIFTGATCIDDAADYVFQQLPSTIEMFTQMGLGKPHRSINAIYDRVAANSERKLNVYCALGLDIPEGKLDMEKRFLTPFVNRLYGEDFPRLKYVKAMKTDTLPENIHIIEYFMQSGAMLGSTAAQTDYTSTNYTHITRALTRQKVNVVYQKMAKGEDGRLSFSCNNDLTLDLIKRLDSLGLPHPLLVAEIDKNLPYIGGNASVTADFFDVVIEPSESYPLFAIPRQSVTLIDYAIGFYTSTLVKDGGTLQIGIGALADSVCFALALRHQDNAKYKAILKALNPAIFDADSEIAKLINSEGGLEPFTVGLYGASEILSEGFKLLVQAGVIKRKVTDDLELMRRINNNTATEADREKLAKEGQYLHGSFYLGSPDFYQWLRDLKGDEKSSIGMEPISKINAINGAYYECEVQQRKDARFINTCIQATLFGGAISETLDNGGVVAGVGGQYDFVSMANLLPGARSMLLLRATREKGGKSSTNIRFEGGHLTIPRHLRDIFITEFGIVDIQDKSDNDCINGMLTITHNDYQQELLETAYKFKKVRNNELKVKTDNTHEALVAKLQPFYDEGTLPDYPLGSDFTPVEQRITKALNWLKAKSENKAEFAALMAQLAVVDLKQRLTNEAEPLDTEALERMGLSDPHGMEETMSAKFLDYALQQTKDK